MDMRIMLKHFGLLVIVAATLSGCGGGMNSPNPNAPTSVNAHECSWVTTHPKKMLELVAFRVISTSTQVSFSTVLSGEQLIQCRVCHGSSFLGAGAGAAGPACYDCHIADPIRYPAGCYSCHGGVALNPQNPAQVAVGLYRQFYRQYSTPEFSSFSTARTAFVARVRSGSIHNRLSPNLPRNHDALSYVFVEANPPANTCGYCHNSSANANVHHSQEITSRFSCFRLAGGCHDVNFDPNGGFEIVVERNCTVCHQ